MVRAKETVKNAYSGLEVKPERTMFIKEDRQRRNYRWSDREDGEHRAHRLT